MRIKLILIVILSSLFLTSCNGTKDDEYTEKERQLLKLGLVDIQKQSESIDVHLVYATPFNFMGKQLYKDMTHAFMLPKSAQMLLEAEKNLKKERPDLSFRIYDAARPISIQHDMWNMVVGTDMEDFVANPTKGRGMHNYGIAIDLTLIDCTGNPLPMGSEYDYFGDEARTNIETELLATGRITQRELENRLLLRKVMTESGFLVYHAEWWHFNSMDVSQIEGINVIP